MRPMLACQYDPRHIQFPVIVQPKLDGIRAVVDEHVAYSRSAKRLPNEFIQAWVQSLREHQGGLGLQCFDGEFIVNSATAIDAFRATDSGVMSRGTEPDFRYHVFDFYSDSHMPYHQRRDYLKAQVLTINDHRLVLVDQHYAFNEDALWELEARFVGMGYEGAILRDPEGTYKFGRSTSREGKLIKLKRYEDAEATVIGFEELYSNQNERTTNALGLTERTSHKANMIPMDTLGALVVVDDQGREFRIGSFLGLNLEERREVWKNQASYLGQKVTYKFQRVGGYDLPRFPIWKGWRRDL